MHVLCRKESLRVLRKMCRYLTKEWLVELCEEIPADPQRAPFTASISEVLAAVLENEVSPSHSPRGLVEPASFVGSVVMLVAGVVDESH